MSIFKKKQNSDGFVKSRYKIGLALSGGGTRGIAHLGVLKAFADNKIKFDYVTGTSAGSLVGAVYCSGANLDDVIAEAKTITRKELINKRFALGSNSANIEQLADRFLQGKTFDQLQIPFACVSVDIASGNEIVLNSGSVSKAVSASCAVPALFTPVKMDDMLLVDGGLLNNMPSDVCRRMGAEIVIGVDLNHNRGKGTTSTNMLNTVMAMWSITTKSTMYKGEINSDIVLEPELSNYKNTTLDFFDERVNEGYRIVVEKLEEIKQLLMVK